MPWTEEPGGLQSMESQESDTTERLNHHFHFLLLFFFFFLSFHLDKSLSPMGYLMKDVGGLIWEHFLNGYTSWEEG